MARKRSNLHQRSSGSWLAHMRVNGTQHQKTFKQKDEALLWLARLEAKKALGQEIVKPKRMNFAEFAEEWVRDYAHPPKLAIRTAEGYEMSLRNYLVPHFGALPLTAITRKRIDSFIADWQRKGPDFQERLLLAQERETARAQAEGRPARKVRFGNSAGTIKNVFIPFREMLGHAVEWGYLEVNPATRIKLPAREWKEEETIQMLSGPEVERLLAHAPADYKVMWMTAVMTGVRLGELRALRWGDVDWDRDQPRLHVRRSVTESGVFQKPKTASSVRRIPIGATLLAALREERMRSRFKSDDDLMFPNSTGTAQDGRNMFNRHFLPTLKKAGLPRVRFHDLRHTCASLCYRRVCR